MQDFFVYILKCRDGSYYTGHADDLEKRLSEHQNNFYPCYTSNKLPIALVFNQSFTSRDEAFTAERKIKNWSRLKKEALIRGDYIFNDYF